MKIIRKFIKRAYKQDLFVFFTKTTVLISSFNNIDSSSLLIEKSFLQMNYSVITRIIGVDFWVTVVSY